MKAYSIFNSSGKLLRTGYCSEEDFPTQAGPGETIKEGISAFPESAVQFSYSGNRLKEYPSAGDQLDAIFKMAQALQGAGIALPAETLAWVNKCQAVKNKYPKE